MYCVHLKRKILRFNELSVLSTYSHMFLIYNHYKKNIYLILHICVFFSILFYFLQCLWWLYNTTMDVISDNSVLSYRPWLGWLDKMCVVCLFIIKIKLNIFFSYKRRLNQRPKKYNIKNSIQQREKDREPWRYIGI